MEINRRMDRLKDLKIRDRVWSTDWLASKPVFYNTKTKKVSHNVNDVIDTNDNEFHHSGFNNYLETGDSVFGQTPVINVKFLSPHSKIRRTEGEKSVCKSWYIGFAVNSMQYAIPRNVSI